MRDLRRRNGLLAAAFALIASNGARGADLEVIYSEVATDPSSTVPGALDAAGQPADTDFLALEDLVLSHDGTQWVVKGRTTQVTTLDSILIFGSGATGTMFAQDGQPFQGGLAGELYDFFDTPSPMSWDESNNLAFSARAKGGLTSVKEKVVKVIGGVHTVVFTESSPTTGLIDVPANPTGDELLGNSIGSVQLLNDGGVFFGNTPIQNCHSSRYPA